MNAKEMAETIKKDERLTGLEVEADERQNAVYIYGFNKTADWKLTKSILAEMGFNCAPNAADWQGEIPQQPSLRERYEQMSDEQKKAAADTFEKMVRS